MGDVLCGLNKWINPVQVPSASEFFGLGSGASLTIDLQDVIILALVINIWEEMGVVKCVCKHLLSLLMM